MYRKSPRRILNETKVQTRVNVQGSPELALEIRKKESKIDNFFKHLVQTYTIVS